MDDLGRAAFNKSELQTSVWQALTDRESNSQPNHCKANTLSIKSPQRPCSQRESCRVGKFNSLHGRLKGLEVLLYSGLICYCLLSYLI